LKEIPVKYIDQNPNNALIFPTNGVSQGGVKSVKLLHKELAVPS
jgi:hypothetical protein